MVPDVEFTIVKVNFVNTVGAFNAAVALNPHIISCSWGASIRTPPLPIGQVPMAAAIANAVSREIVVVFYAGWGSYIICCIIHLERDRQQTRRTDKPMSITPLINR